MKIEGSSKTLSPTLVKDTRGSATRQAGASSNGEEVQLSSLAAQMRATDDGYAFDSARVAEIKQAIAEGRFSINASAIADRLIASTKELLDSNRQA